VTCVPDHRGTTTQRGYGAEHQAERARWAPTVEAGEGQCAERVCLEENEGRGRWIPPDAAWHLAHAEGQHGYRGPAHARCNISEASKRMHGTATAPHRWVL
jgi:hypothetical protein